METSATSFVSLTSSEYYKSCTITVIESDGNPSKKQAGCFQKWSWLVYNKFWVCAVIYKICGQKLGKNFKKKMFLLQREDLFSLK